MLRKLIAIFCAFVFLLSVSCSAFAEPQAQKRFEEAQELLAQKDYAGAKKIFSELDAYPDAARFAMYAGALENAEAGLFSLAAQDFAALGDFTDSELRAAYYKARNWEEKEEYEIAGKTYLDISGYLDSTDRILTLPGKINIRDYAKADALERKNKLEEALEAFVKLGDYSDSKDRAAGVQEKINARDYAAAAKLEEEEKFDEAIEAFKKLAGYSDSAERIKAIVEKINAREYTAAAKLEEEGKLEAALTAFEKLGDYSDSANRVVTISEKIRARDYAEADQLEKEEHFSKAYRAFLALNEYQDSADRAEAIHAPAIYEEALAEADAGQYKNAAELFASLGEYRDSQDKAYVLGVSQYVDTTFAPTDGIFIFSHHDLYGMANYHDNVLRPAYFNEVRAFENGHATYRLGSKWGLLYADGRALVPQWDEIDDFKNGIAVYTSSGKCGLLYEDGSTTPAEWSDIKPFSNVGGEKLAKVKWNGKYGYIDTQGNIVIEPVWSEIKEFRAIGDKYLAEVIFDGKHGFIDSKNNVVLLPEWEAVSAFNSNGVCLIVNQTSASAYRFGLADAEGNILCEPTYIKLGIAESSTYEEDSVLSSPPAGPDPIFVIAANGKYGYINGRGELLVDTIYDNAKGFSEGLCAVKKDGLWGYVDKTGTVVIQPEYVDATSFSNGTADVLVKGSGWHVIDQNNSRVYYTTNAIAEAEKLLLDGKYEEAANAYEKLLGIDPSLKIKQQTALYSAAEKALEAGEVANAITFFAKAGDYSDSAERILKIYYELAEELLAAGEYDDAIYFFAEAGNYSDSAERILKIHYDLAEKALVSEDWDTASSEFEAAGSYLDASDRVKEPYYKKAELLLAEGDYTAAIEAFTKLGDYSDSAERILKIHYDLAVKAMEEHRWDDAYSEFAFAGDYRDAVTCLSEIYYRAAETYLNDKEYDKAIEYIAKAGEKISNSVKVNLIHYIHAENALAMGQREEAVKAFKDAGNFRDAADKIFIINSFNATESLKEGRWEDAKGAFIDLGHYEQDGDINNGKEEVDWIMLDINEERALLLSRFILDVRAYNNKNQNLSWEKSTLRKWLNKEFWEECFNQDEQNCILITEIDNSDEATNKQKKVKRTKDGVFLLSASEIQKYYPNMSDRKSKVSTYVKNVDKPFIFDGYSSYYLRTARNKNKKPDVAYIQASTGVMSYNKGTDKIGIRPAVWVNTSAIRGKVNRFEESLKTHYELAEKAMTEKNWTMAIAEFEAAGMYKDAVMRTKEAYYKAAEECLAKEDQSGAFDLFMKSIGFGDAIERIKDIHFENSSSEQDTGNSYKSIFDAYYDHYMDMYSVIVSRQTNMLASPSGAAKVIRTVKQYTPVIIIEESDGMYTLVQLDDGTEGYVPTNCLSRK